MQRGGKNMDKNSLFDKIMEEPDPKKAKLPLWVHYVLRISLQLFLGWAVYYGYIKNYTLITVFAGFLFVYHIITLFFGPQIRKAILEVMSNM